MKKIWRIDREGYRRRNIYLGGGAKNPKFKTILEHRLVMENHIGRMLLRSECVHHKNGNKLDNNICNLEIISWSDHYKKHLDGLVIARKSLAKKMNTDWKRKVFIPSLKKAIYKKRGSKNERKI